jgi:hypothetical protein
MFMRCGAMTVLLLSWVVGFSGCGLMQPWNSMTRYTKNLFTFRGTDAYDPTEEEDAPWVSEAAQEARSGQMRERDPDQWYKKYVMSEKARSIERNLGFD